jgi:hypothetical protein
MLQNQERLRLYEFQGIQLVMNMSNKGLYPCGEGQVMRVELSQLPLMERNVP